MDEEILKIKQVAYARGVKDTEAKHARIKNMQTRERTEAMQTRIRDNAALVAGKTTDEIAELIGLKIDFPSARGRVCPQIISLAHNLAVSGFERGSQRRGHKVVRVWRSSEARPHEYDSGPEEFEVPA